MMLEWRHACIGLRCSRSPCERPWRVGVCDAPCIAGRRGTGAQPLRRRRVTMLEEELKSANVDVSAIAEWQRRDTEYRGRLTDLEAATQARNQARGPPRCRMRQAASAGTRSGWCTHTGPCWV